MTVRLLSSKERSFATLVGELTYSNPFSHRRLELEALILKTQIPPKDAVWHIGMQRDEERAPIKALKACCVKHLKAWGNSLALATEEVCQEDLQHYEDVVVFHLYHLCSEELEEIIRSERDKTSPKVRRCWLRYSEAYDHFLRPQWRVAAPSFERAHLFACFYQARRAFHNVFTHLSGRSSQSAALRASIWQSLFTHDLKRYRRSLYNMMPRICTLISGPSGTGKELVARAIGQSSYIAFDETKRDFVEHPDRCFAPLNLSAMPLTLVESELFGHRKGAFTGALSSRVGWLESIPQQGTVFIDEIGELEALIQVKLLRVLQSRQFQPLGDVVSIDFSGKFVAATNRDLAVEIREGRFREDLYYRLCSDIIRTPALKEILRDQPDSLAEMLAFTAQGFVGAEEVDALVSETVEVIRASLPLHYDWPGNFRELEQCLKNTMIHRGYEPIGGSSSKEEDPFMRDILSCRLSADELMRTYCRKVYELTGSYEESARRLGMNWRTVKSKVQGKDKD